MRRLWLASVLLASACPPEEPPCEPGWKVLLDRAELDRPILSLWGDDRIVYAVGGGVRAPGVGALARRWQGGSWTELDTGRDETLWWVWGSDAARDVWMVGERGLVLRWNGSAFAVLPQLTGATLFGVWGQSAGDVWMVGGTPGAGMVEGNDVVLHWDGRTLSADGPPAVGAALFKVWGTAADDLWVAGEGGLLWHRTASGWTRYDAGTRSSLITVHGCGPSEVYAVGGTGVFRWDGAAWSRVADANPLAGANGVSCGRDQVLVVGNGGLKLRFERATSRWIDETTDAPFATDFHVAWISPSGGLWAGGGNFNAPPAAGRYGVLGFWGCPLPR